MLKRWLFKIDDKISNKKILIFITNKLFNTVIDVKYISGSFMFFRRNIFNKLGGFNNKFLCILRMLKFVTYKKSNFNIGILKELQLEHLRNRGSL